MVCVFTIPKLVQPFHHNTCHDSMQKPIGVNGHPLTDVTTHNQPHWWQIVSLSLLWQAQSFSVAEAAEVLV